MPKVSVVVPVYGVAQYIERCARSLMEQTLEDAEFIFIDDCSPDDSAEMLQKVVAEYPDRNVRIIRNEINRGTATVRNIGIDEARGKYIIYVDGDDWVERDELETLYQEAERRKLDLVYCDYYESYKDHEKLVRQNFGEDRAACLCSMSTRAMHGSTCNKLWLRQSLLHAGIRFVDGADLFEDLGFCLRFFALPIKIGYIPRAFYHYVQYNDRSVVHSMMHPSMSRKRALQRIKNIEVASQFLEKRGCLKNHALRKGIDQQKLLAKNDLLTPSDFSLKRWMLTFPESDRAIWLTRDFSLNFKLLLTWLHMRWIPLYKLQKRITSLAR